jgi:hypothetical protein
MTALKEFATALFLLAAVLALYSIAGEGSW